MGAEQSMLSGDVPAHPEAPIVPAPEPGAAELSNIEFGSTPAESLALEAAARGGKISNFATGPATKGGLYALMAEMHNLSPTEFALRGAASSLFNPTGIGVKGLNQVAPFSFAAKTGAENIEEVFSEQGISDPTEQTEIGQAAQMYNALSSPPPIGMFAAPVENIAEELPQITQKAQPLTTQAYQSLRKKIPTALGLETEPEVPTHGLTMDESIDELTEAWGRSPSLQAVLASIDPTTGQSGLYNEETVQAALKGELPSQSAPTLSQPTQKGLTPATPGYYAKVEQGTAVSEGEQTGSHTEAGSLQGGPSVSPTGRGDPGEGDGDGDKILCGTLNQMGILDDFTYQSDLEYAKRFISDHTIQGYKKWAKPVVNAIKKHKWIAHLAKPFVMSWANHMHYLLGKTNKKHRFGAILKAIGVPASNLCHSVTNFIKWAFLMGRSFGQTWSILKNLFL
jgi:hypothetical protein